MIVFIPIGKDKKVLKVINNCVKTMIDMETYFLYESCIKDDKEELMDFLSDFFPPHLCREEPKKCENVLKDLSEWTNDSYLHQLGCIHEYALFKIINFFFNEKEDYEKYREKGKKNIYKFHIKNLENYEPEEIRILKRVNDRDFYEEGLFIDLDFLFIDKIVYLYQTDKKIYNSLGVNLEYYLDLMPKDMREEIKASLDYEYEKDETQKFVLNQINNVIHQMEMDPIRLNKLKEDEISDDIKNRIQFSLEMKNIIIEREARGGFARKEIGEMDFYIYQNKNHVYEQLAIGENKNWGEFENQVKQLLGYSNKNIKFGFTITINRDKSYQQVKETQIEILENFSSENFRVINVEKYGDTVVSTHIVPEENINFKIYHFILNANVKERKEIALEARNNEPNVKTTSNTKENDKEKKSNTEEEEIKIKNNILEKLNGKVTFDDMKNILKDLEKNLSDEEHDEIIKKLRKIGTKKRKKAKVKIENKKCNIQVFGYEDAPIMGFVEKIKNSRSMSDIYLSITKTIRQYEDFDGDNEYAIKSQFLKEAIKIAEEKYGFLELLKDKKIDVFITNKSRSDLKSYLYKDDWVNNEFEIFIYAAEDAIYTLLHQLGLIVCMALCDKDELVPKSFIKINRKVKVNLLDSPIGDRVGAFSDIFAVVALRGSDLECFAPFLLNDESSKIFEEYFKEEIEKKVNN